MSQRCPYVQPIVGRCALPKGHAGEHYADSITNRPAVMNSPADEAEARDRAHRAPGQADRDAARSGVSGLASRPEARPVTPTEQLTSNHVVANMYAALSQIEQFPVAAKCMRLGIAEIERLRGALERIREYEPANPHAGSAAHREIAREALETRNG